MKAVPPAGSCRFPARPEVRVLAREEPLPAGRRGLQRYTVERRRGDGSVSRRAREVYRRGECVAVLLWSRRRGTVVLTRQFRLGPVVMGEAEGLLVEVPGGLLDGEPPLEAGRREVEEETGYRMEGAREILGAYTSPSVLAERVHLLVADLDLATRVSRGGGLEEEGEEVEVLEITLEEAIGRMDRGEIVDARTIILLQHAWRLHLEERARPDPDPRQGRRP